MMTMWRLLRLDGNPKESPHGIVVSAFYEPDHFLGWNEDGSMNIEEGARLEQWGYDPSYAPFRRRIWRGWLRLCRLFRREDAR